MQIQTYTVIEKDTSTVSKLWKFTHIILLLTAAVSGFLTCYSLGEVVHAFGENCVLYADIAFESPTTSPPLLTFTTSTELTNVTNTTSNGTITTPSQSPFIKLEVKNRMAYYSSIDLTDTEWGTYRTCSFCQFTPLMSMIFALCWLMFFIMCGPGGAGYPSDVLSKPWHVVYPAWIFSTLFSIILSISTVQTSNGLTDFCADFKEHVIFNVYRCIPEIDEFTAIFWDGHKKGAYFNSLLCFIFAHVGVMAWWAQTALLLLRILCVADFDILWLRKSTRKEKESQLLPTNVQEEHKEEEKEVYTMIKPTNENVITPAASSPSQQNCVCTDDF